MYRKAGDKKLIPCLLPPWRPVCNQGLFFSSSLSDALDSSSSKQTIYKTTRKIVDGKVVSETNDIKVLQR